MANQEFTLSQEFLNQIFEYRDGELYWKIKPSNSVKIGNKAGCLDTSNGYYVVRIKGKMHGLHRIVFAMHYDVFPKMIDHIDGNPKNNKIENLRKADDKQNQWNQKLHSRNTSGFKNVFFRKDKKKWACRLQVNGKTISRGAFNTPEEASVYAEQLRIQFHGEFARNL